MSAALLVAVAAPLVRSVSTPGDDEGEGRDLRRGDIWMYRFDRPDTRRPVVVFSRQRVLEHLHTATIAPITSTIRGLESEVRLGPEHGLKHESVVNLDHIVTIPQADLGQYVGHLDAQHMRRVCRALNVALACE